MEIKLWNKWLKKKSTLYVSNWPQLALRSFNQFNTLSKYCRQPIFLYFVPENFFYHMIIDWFWRGEVANIDAHRSLLYPLCYIRDTHPLEPPIHFGVKPKTIGSILVIASMFPLLWKRHEHSHSFVWFFISSTNWINYYLCVLQMFIAIT